MASIYKDIPIDAPPDAVWDAVRDFGAVHQRLNPGFVTDCRLDGNARIVTFHNGNVVREDLVDRDEARRRLAYAITGRERVSHFTAGFLDLVFAARPACCRCAGLCAARIRRLARVLLSGSVLLPPAVG